jgi:hypothetical protein
LLHHHHAHHPTKREHITITLIALRSQGPPRNLQRLPEFSALLQFSLPPFKFSELDRLPLLLAALLEVEAALKFLAVPTTTMDLPPDANK